MKRRDALAAITSTLVTASARPVYSATSGVPVFMYHHVNNTIPSSALAPAWLNQTSTVSPTGRVAFAHFAEPWTGNPDYTLVTGR